MINSFKLFFFILVCLFLLPKGVQAQEPTLVHYTIEDGLPSNTVYYIYKDSKGFLWFATDKGIARYNGITFKCFTTIDGMADNEIFGMQEDNFGRLWLFTFNGNLCYYKDGVFHTEENTPWLYLPVKSMINYVISEADSSVRVQLTDEGRYLHIKNNRVTQRYINKSKFQTRSITMIHKNKINSYKMYDIENNSILDIDTSANLLYKRKLVKNSSYIVTNQANDTTQFLFHGNKLYSLNEDLLYTFSNIDTSIKQQVLHVIKTNGIYFITTKTGLHLGNSFQLFKGQTINWHIKDINDDYWVATYNKGIYGFYKDYAHTRIYNQIYKSKVWDGKLIDGKLFYVLEDGSLHQLVQDKDKCLFDPFAFFKNTPSSMANERGYLEHRNYWYIGNENLYRLANITAPVPDISIKRSSGYAAPKKIFAAARQAFLFYHTNLFSLPIPEIFAASQPKDARLAAYSHKRIYASAIDADETVWYATLDSMYKMHPGGEQLYQPQFHNIGFKDFGFYGQYLVGFTHRNNLYIINKYSAQQIEQAIVTNQNCVWEKMYQIDPDHILISTNNHYRLLTLSPSTGKPVYQIRTIENPYIPDHAEYVCGDRNYVYFFKDGNITSIYTSDLLKETPVPRILFSEVKTANRTLPIHESIALTYKESREVSISFVPISFYSRDLYYEYSITGKDEQEAPWQTIKGEVITLLKPQYGNYKIKVRVRSVSSDFSTPAVIELTILKPYWATAWFISLCALAIIALTALVLWIFYRRKLRIQSQEYNANIKYQKSEYKALNALMNPHFIFNSLNNIQGLINSNDKKAANEYLVIFSDLVRQNMHNISEGAITLYQELELVRNYLILEKLRFDDLVNYTLDIDEETDTEAIDIPPLLIQPLVENAIRHGLLPRQSPQSMLWIKVYEEDEKVYVEIRDNGIGLEQSRAGKMASAHKSYGLENLMKRIEHWNAINQQSLQFTIENAGDAGTVALIIIA